jgi:alpha-1,2-mannosyltransferase
VTSSRWSLTVGCGVSAVAAAVAILALRTAPVDLAVYRAGGQAVLGGRPLYQGAVADGLDFTYPPVAALLFVPLAVPPAILVQVLVCVGNLALLAFVCRRSLIALGEVPGRRLTMLVLVAAGLLFWLDSVRTTVYLGQVNLALLAVVLWDVLRPDARRTKGIGVGIAAGIKLTPLIFVLYLLVTRRFRAAATAGAAFAATVLLGFLLVPGDAARYWLGGVFADSSRVFSNLASPHNQSLYGLLARLGAPRPLWFVLAAVAIAVTLWLAVKANRRGEHLLALTLCGLLGPVVSPWSWNHHWVWLVPLALFIARRLTADLYWLVPVMLLPLVLPWIADLTDPPVGFPRVAGGPAAFLLGNPYVLIYVLVLACATRYLRQPQSAHREPTEAM